MTQSITLKQACAATAAALAVSLLQGCASGPQANPADPLEPFNRGVFGFNEGLDRTVLKPVATAYRDTLPAPVRTSVGNFFGNISDAWSFVNNLLQGQPAQAKDSFFRFTTNTFLGVGGVFDVAGNKLNIPKHREDFGQTLGVWGLDAGPYLVLPVLGSSSVRDTAGLVVDWQGNLVGRMGYVPGRNSLTGLNLIDTRASLLEAGNVLDQAALDKYAFARDFYLQRRRSLIGKDDAAKRAEPEERFDLPEAGPSSGVPVAPASGTR